MRKPILLALALMAASCGAANAQSFTVAAPSAGAFTMTGTGTANFNQSNGTSNSFQVGSSTNLGASASTSSTPEYGVTSTAATSLAGTSTLQQTIGTAGVFKQNESTASYAGSSAASYAATQSAKVASEWGVNSSGSYEGTWGAQETKTKNGVTYNYSQKGEYEAAAKQAIDVEYKQQYAAGFAAAANYSSTQTQSSGNQGVISGRFITSEVSSASAAGSGSATEWAASASASANTAVAGRNTLTETERQNAWDAAYSAAYSSASAGLRKNTDSSVTVTGIGSDAKVALDESATYKVDIANKVSTSSGSTATANGSASGSLATSSFANQNQATTASAFFQAFGGSPAE